MSQSGNLFLALRDAETNLPEIHLQPKKLIKENAKDNALKLVESGEVDIIQVFSKTARLEEYLKETNKVLRVALKDEIAEKTKSYGVEFQVVNGASRPNYKEDEEWVRLKAKLTAREKLLKTAIQSNEPIYDSEGVEIPRVSTSGGGLTLKATF